MIENKPTSCNYLVLCCHPGGGLRQIKADSTKDGIVNLNEPTLEKGVFISEVPIPLFLVRNLEKKKANERIPNGRYPLGYSKVLFFISGAYFCLFIPADERKYCWGVELIRRRAVELQLVNE